MTFVQQLQEIDRELERWLSSEAAIEEVAPWIERRCQLLTGIPSASSVELFTALTESQRLSLAVTRRVHRLRDQDRDQYARLQQQQRMFRQVQDEIAPTNHHLRVMG